MPIDDVVPELGLGHIQMLGQGTLNRIVARRRPHIQVALRDIEAAAFKADVHDGHTAVRSIHHELFLLRYHVHLAFPLLGSHKRKARTSSKSSFTPPSMAWQGGSVGFEPTGQPTAGHAKVCMLLRWGTSRLASANNPALCPTTKGRT